jgi:hypothetical protein
MSDPIVVLYKSNSCFHCNSLSEIWDKSSGGNDSVVDALKKVYPKLRFFVLTSKDNSGKFDENTAPKDLKRYGRWYPMVLLIPGKVWDTAMSKLGPKSEAQILEGVQIMNGYLKNGQPEILQKYDTKKPSEFAKWLKDSLENEDFKKVQNSNGNSLIVPTIEQTSNIQPHFPKIMRPNNSTSNYVPNNTDLQINGDVCSMRIISRPK